MKSHYDVIARAIGYLSERAAEQPSLEALSSELGISPFHLQRTFKKYAGVTPKQFLAALTVQRAKSSLDGDASILDATLETGLSSPSRLHDHFISIEGVTPGEYKSGGAGIVMGYGTAKTPFGAAAIATSERGLSLFEFLDTCAAEDVVRASWPGATLHRDDGHVQAIAERVFTSEAESMRVLVRGTSFQLRVWRALLATSVGETTGYGALARQIGNPTASRAVGNAMASNHIAVLIPCHRVLATTGVVGNYRWGTPRKRALLAWERARSKQDA